MSDIRIDYKSYKLDVKETIACIIIYTFIIAVISLLFYNSLFAGFAMYPFIYVFIKVASDRQRRKRCRQLQIEFGEMLDMLSASLSAGYSLERAFMPVYEEIHGIYKGNSLIENELLIINRGLQLNESIEVLLNDFGERSGISDIREFSQVIVVAKRTGGNIVKIIKKTTEHMRSRREVESEIATMVAAKRMEQRIMSIMPCVIIAYMRLTNGAYMDCLYGNPAGIVVMSICLIAAMLSIYWGRRIVEIEV